TGVSNLGLPCKKHHRMRHITGWEPTPATKDDPPGWISPSGRYYTSESQDWQPPHWPPGLLPGIEPNPLLDGVLLESPPEGFADEAFLFEEPPDDHLIDEDDLPPEHEAWDILYTMPNTLPPDPCKDWELHPPDSR
ncbi:hypothetical protein, partial [Escherichia coli]|uniref:hypothetical protein n=1 Tax=Escherichia coli TaxID=562 RepID=UPI0032E4AF5D